MAAHEAPLKTRQEEIADIWKENTWLYAVGGFLAGVLFLPFLQLAITDIADLLNGLVTEAVGIGFTVVFIDVLYRRREEQRRIKDLQEQLVRDAGSTFNEIAKNAVHQLKKHGWLTGDDGLLKGANLILANLKEAREARLIQANLEGANLMAANLEGADLAQANLEEAILKYANLQGAFFVDTHLEGADLYNANLEEAILMAANLEGANLGEANLGEADLRFANLEGANIREANLKGVDLELANLEGVNLVEAVFNENTTLPDGSKWTPETDMRRFTDPQHPDFWRSDHPNSPAYRSKDNG